MDNKKAQARDNDGRYKLDGNWERMCMCGHTLGQHFAEKPRNCCENDSYEHCTKFTQVKNPSAISLGSIKSKKKAKTSAENGKKGGRPKKKVL